VTLGVRPDLGATGELQPVAAQFARSLTAACRRIRSVRVVSYQPDGVKPPLYVDGAVSGSPSSTELRLWLVDGGTGRAVWTRAVRGHVAEVLGQEGSLVAEAVEAVRSRLPAAEGGPEVSPRLRRLCLRGELGWLTFTRRGLQASVAAWKDAIALDPGYAPAYAGLSASESVSALLGYRPPAEAESRARESARRALELAPDLPAGRLARALVRLLFDLDAAGAEELALRQSPFGPEDLRLTIVQALVLDARGRLSEARRVLAPAIQLDPHAAGLLFVDAQGLQMDGRWSEAASVYDRAIGEEPAFDLARRNRATCLAASRRTADALLALGGAVVPGVASPQAALRDLWRRRCLAGGPQLEEVFRACLSAGDLGRASAALASSVEGRWPYVVFVPHDVASAPLRDSPAYRALLSRLASGGGEPGPRLSAAPPRSPSPAPTPGTSPASRP
jgi:tetratricopeptide (TPR) repeat protein